MKIGFSFGTCLASIVRNEVEYNDVLCIIAGTYMNDETDVIEVTQQYMNRELHGLSYHTCIDMALRLFRGGKVLEPRANNIQPMQIPREYVWMDLFPTATLEVPISVRTAWDSYRVLLQISKSLPSENHKIKIGARNVNA
jgi:hypothetical protein